MQTVEMLYNVMSLMSSIKTSYVAKSTDSNSVQPTFKSWIFRILKIRSKCTCETYMWKLSKMLTIN